MFQRERASERVSKSARKDRKVLSGVVGERGRNPERDRASLGRCRYPGEQHCKSRSVHTDVHPYLYRRRAAPASARCCSRARGLALTFLVYVVVSVADLDIYFLSICPPVLLSSTLTSSLSPTTTYVNQIDNPAKLGLGFWNAPGSAVPRRRLLSVA